MTVESDIQLNPSGTGPKVRTVQVQTLISGVATTVEMQVVGISDQAGNVIDDFADYRLGVESLLELSAIRRGLEILTATKLRG